jgi:hypothetical protein
MSYKSKYRLFKVVKAGMRSKEVSLLPYGFKNLSLAKSYAVLEFSANSDSFQDIIVKDNEGNVVFKANANKGGIREAYLEKAKDMIVKVRTDL